MVSPATKQSLINSLERDVQILLFGIALANSIDELRNGRAEMIRATGAVLIASVLLYFIQTLAAVSYPDLGYCFSRFSGWVLAFARSAR